MKPVRFIEEAEIEFMDSIVHIEQRRTGHGERFRNAVYAVREMISRFPEIGARYPGTPCRQHVMIDFPYSVIYAESTDAIEIIAIAHAKRRPGYWKSRLPRS